MTVQRESRTRMTRYLTWAIAPIIMVLAACSGQASTTATTPPPPSATAESRSEAPAPVSIISTPPPWGTPESTSATATPIPSSSTGGVTPTPPQDQTTNLPILAATLTTVLSITVADIQTGMPEYDRSQWKHWTDEDGDCQDARQEVLISESLVEVTFEDDRKCRVAKGRWYGALTGTYLQSPGELDIDHLVPLKNAHDSGAWVWDSAKKEQYANYLGNQHHLIAVTKGANRSKGAKGPEKWLPPDESYWCQYATDWTEVKMEWGLTMTQREAEAVIEMLATCTEPVEFETTRLEETAGSGGLGETSVGEAAAAPTLVPQPEPRDHTSVYGSCEEAVEAGELRVQGSAGGGRGFEREMVPSARDGDGDGVVCER